MNTRIKEIRKSLKLTQEEFGKIIGLKRSSVCDIENNRCNVTERLFIAICSKFHVNEEWLRNGTGEMFIKEDLKYNEFFKIYNNLSPVLQDFLLKTAKNLLDSQNKLNL